MSKENWVRHTLKNKQHRVKALEKAVGEELAEKAKKEYAKISKA